MLQTIKETVQHFRSFKPQRTDGLDLCYIPFGLPESKRIIAMCGLADGSIKDAFLRNDLDEVAQYLARHHDKHFRVYNLTEKRGSARVYEMLQGQCVHVPMPDHNVPTFEQLLMFCIDADRFLRASPDNVIAVHCKAGKGRTGLAICAFLVFAGACRTVQEAMRVFAVHRSMSVQQTRTLPDGSRVIVDVYKGVDQSSQVRWVHYFAELLQAKQRADVAFFRPRGRIFPVSDALALVQPSVQPGDTETKQTADHNATTDLSSGSIAIPLFDAPPLPEVGKQLVSKNPHSILD